MDISSQCIQRTILIHGMQRQLGLIITQINPFLPLNYYFLTSHREGVRLGLMNFDRM